MTAVLIDGKALAAQLLGALSVKASALSRRLGRQPCLAVVMVGENPASQLYVRSKSLAAAKVGIEPRDVKLPATISNADLQQQLKLLAGAGEVDGILLQLPLPPGLDEFAALCAIPPELDVDGLHPYNQGLLLRGAGHLRPCTPLGVLALIDEASRLLSRKSDLTGQRALVIGRSVLVGKPVSFLLQERNATVTMAHSKTENLRRECGQADIVVAAIGRPEFVDGSWLKPGGVVIDVGINRLASGKLVGDVAHASALPRVAAITPVPGGVGPMTIAMLLSNTLESASQRT